MKKSTTTWQLCGIVTTFFLGTLFHFLYEWSNQSVLVAPFCAVNESTWEHMKLLFFPSFAFALVQNFFFKDQRNFWCVKLKGVLIGLALIPVIFYTYNGVVTSSPDWLNVVIFFVAVATEYLYEIKLFPKETPCKLPKLAFAILCAIALLFVLFTFVTPKINIFLDPQSGNFGIC